MAQVLAEGTGAHWAQVWLMVNDELVLAATWPPRHRAPIATPPGADASARPAGPDGAPGRRAPRRAAAPGARATSR